MKRKNLMKNAWGIGLTLLLLFGCSPQATLTPTPALPTTAPVPPTSTPTPTPEWWGLDPVPTFPPFPTPPKYSFSGPIAISGTA
ncbi:MAG: hypothetical protein Q7T89_11935, partial [Anaerolineales bacterium]|nr:hypothetical protein [Anaerolineales bacterium]